MTKMLATVRYDARSGLVPVVVQEASTGAVLTLAYANREAVKRTLASREAWFYSRSRRELWHKGATSGNIQKVLEVRVDCDGDALLYLVAAHGPACHTGASSCFFTNVVSDEAYPGALRGESSDFNGNSLEQQDEGGAGEAIAGAASTAADQNENFPVDFEALAKLWDTIVARDKERPSGSYTSLLFQQGLARVAKKVGEEGVEVALAAVQTGAPKPSPTHLPDKEAGHAAFMHAELAHESADLLYHLLVLWRIAGVAPPEVLNVLRSRSR